MFINKTIISFITILLVYSVTCDEAEEIKRRGLERARQLHQYNHPPAAENYKTIPVAILYDKVIDRSSRGRARKVSNPSTRSTVSSLDIKDIEDKNKIVYSKLALSPETSTSVNTLIETKHDTTTEEPKEASVLFLDDINTPKPKELRLEYKIPVSVVYDKEPAFVKRHGIKSGVSTRIKIPIYKQHSENNTSEAKSELIVHEVSTGEQTNPSTNSLKSANTDHNINQNTKRRRKLTSQKEKSGLPRKTIENVNSNIDLKNNIPNVNSVKAQVNPNSNVHPIETYDNPYKNQLATGENNTKRSNDSITSQIITKNVSSKKSHTRTETSKLSQSTETRTKTKRLNGEPDPIVPIVQSESFVSGGDFVYSYEGGDGTKAYSKGKLKTFNIGTEKNETRSVEAVEGGFSYKDKDGNDFSLSYTADENGYRPVGEHLPTPPPIPPAIARALQYLATKTTPEPVTEAQDDHDEESTYKSG